MPYIPPASPQGYQGTPTGSLYEIAQQDTRRKVEQALNAQQGSANYYNIPFGVKWSDYYPDAYQTPGGRWIIPGVGSEPPRSAYDIPRDLQNQIGTAMTRGYQAPPSLLGYGSDALNGPYNPQQGPFSEWYKPPNAASQQPAPAPAQQQRGPGDMNAAMGVFQSQWGNSRPSVSPGTPEALGYGPSPWSQPSYGGGGGMNFSGDYVRTFTPPVVSPPKPTPGTQPPTTGPAPHPWTPTPINWNQDSTISVGSPPNTPGATVPPGLPSTSGSGPLTMKDPMSVISEIASGNYAWTPNQQGGGGATVPDSVNKMFNPQGQQNKNNYWGDISSQVWQT